MEVPDLKEFEEYLNGDDFGGYILDCFEDDNAGRLVLLVLEGNPVEGFTIELEVLDKDLHFSILERKKRKHTNLLEVSEFLSWISTEADSALEELKNL